MLTKLTAAQLAEAMTDLSSWSSRAGLALERSLAFADSVTAIGFVVRVAMHAEVMGHHPELHIVYNRVDITLTTHDASGITDLDVSLAKRIDACVGPRDLDS
ncbi:MAG: hypothetical protein RL685_6365 [Pseudomonadota bacterium]|jgi:4a-hydroxytetrahydrobiopterin dehydratase